jgi:hypothetical protein
MVNDIGFGASFDHISFSGVGRNDVTNLGRYSTAFGQ